MRGSGETTRQMQAAKKGSVFIWPTSAIGCAKAIANRAGRNDLIIRSPSWLDNEGNFRGRSLGDIDIVIDHACWDHDVFNERRYRALHLARAMCR